MKSHKKIIVLVGLLLNSTVMFSQTCFITVETPTIFPINGSTQYLEVEYRSPSCMSALSFGGVASWVDIEAEEPFLLSVTVSPNNTGAPRSNSIVVSTSSASYSINVEQSGPTPLEGGEIYISGESIICSGEDPSIIGNASLPSGGSGGYVYDWEYSDNGISNWNMISGGSLSYNPPAGLTVDRWFRRVVTSGNQTAYSNSVGFTVNEIPVSPTVSATPRCGPGTVAMTASGISGATYRWYTASGSYITTGSIYSPNIASSTNYQVSATVNGCEGPKAPVTATVKAIPNAPTVNAVPRCGPGTVAMTASGISGATYRWYTASGSYITTGSIYSPNIASSTNYQVSATVNGCEGPKAPVTATVKAIPNAPTVSATPRCGPGTVAMTASGISGATYRWYTASGGYITTGNTYSPNITSSTNYQVSATVNGCEGPQGSCHCHGEGNSKCAYCQCHSTLWSGNCGHDRFWHFRCDL